MDKKKSAFQRFAFNWRHLWYHYCILTIKLGVSVILLFSQLSHNTECIIIFKIFQRLSTKSLCTSILYATFSGIHVCTLKDANKCNCWFHTGHLVHVSFLFNSFEVILWYLCANISECVCLNACMCVRFILCALICILYRSVWVSL